MFFFCLVLAFLRFYEGGGGDFWRNCGETCPFGKGGLFFFSSFGLQLRFGRRKNKITVKPQGQDFN